MRIIKIKSCKECPYRAITEYETICNQMPENPRTIELDDENIIPDWCNLDEVA